MRSLLVEWAGKLSVREHPPPYPRWTRERVWGTGIRWFVKNGSRDDPAASAAAEVKLFLPHEGPERGHARANCGWTQMDAVTK